LEKCVEREEKGGKESGVREGESRVCGGVVGLGATQMG